MLKVSIDKTSEKICFRNQVKWIAFMKIFEYWHDFASVETEFEIRWIDKILWRNDMRRKNHTLAPWQMSLLSGFMSNLTNKYFNEKLVLNTDIQWIHTRKWFVS